VLPVRTPETFWTIVGAVTPNVVMTAKNAAIVASRFLSATQT
jgi:hypothetical protein